MKLMAPWVRFAYGPAFDRRTEQYLEAAGLELLEKKFLYRDIIIMLTVRARPQPNRLPQIQLPIN